MAFLWKNKTNRTIIISVIFLILLFAMIIFLSVYDNENKPIPSLNWAFSDVGLIIIVSLLFWGVYFNFLLLVGSIREKMNALPGWTEVIFSAIITILPAIFLGNLTNYAVKWVVFGATFFGVILITIWFLMSTTPKEEAGVKS